MRANNTKGIKVAIIDWITPKGQTLNLHIPCNVKSGQGFHYEWQNSQCVFDSCYKKVLTQYLCRIKEKLHRDNSRSLGINGLFSFTPTTCMIPRIHVTGFFIVDYWSVYVLLSLSNNISLTISRPISMCSLCQAL